MSQRNDEQGVGHRRQGSLGYCWCNPFALAPTFSGPKHLKMVWNFFAAVKSVWAAMQEAIRHSYHARRAHLVADFCVYISLLRVWFLPFPHLLHALQFWSFLFYLPKPTFGFVFSTWVSSTFFVGRRRMTPSEAN